VNNEQQTQTADDPSGPGWRDVEPDEILQIGDMFWLIDHWESTQNIGTKSSLYGNGYRRRIEPQQPSDSEPVPDNDDDIERAVEELENNMTVTLLDAAQQRCRELDADLRTAEQQNAELSALLAEADQGGQQVNAELQQLRGQLATSQHLAEMSRRQVQDEAGKIEQLKEQLQTLTQERDRLQSWLQEHHKTGQQSAVKKLERWLKPVLKVVSDHPDHSSILAASVLEFLPQIASRLIEE
jgi:hypothetical protein